MSHEDLDKANQKIAEMEAWKESALKVMSDINLQEVAKLLSIPLGASISDKIVPGIEAIQFDNIFLLARIREMEEAIR